MRLSVNVSLPDIERTLNQVYEGELYRGSVRDWAGGDSEVVVTKAGPISLTGANTYVKGEVPASIQVDIRQKDPGLLNALKSIAGIRRLEATIRADFRIHLHLQTDFRVAITIDSDFAWITKPTIGSLLPVKISAWLEPAIRRGLAQQAGEIKDALLAKLDLPESLQAPWEQIFSPVQLEPDASLFAKAELLKREVGISPVMISPRKLSAQLELPISAGIFSGVPDHEDPPSFPVGTSIERSEAGSSLLVTSLITPDQLLQFLPARYRQCVATTSPESASLLFDNIGKPGFRFRIFPSIRESDQMLVIRQVSVEKARILRPVRKWLENWILRRANHAIETAIRAAMADLQAGLAHKPLGGGWHLDVRNMKGRFLQQQILMEGLFIQGQLTGAVGLHLDDL